MHTFGLELCHFNGFNGIKSPFLDILITKSGKQIWINIFSKATNFKDCIFNLYNHPKLCLKSILFCLVERQNIGYMRLNELRITLETQK